MDTITASIDMPLLDDTDLDELFYLECLAAALDRDGTLPWLPNLDRQDGLPVSWDHHDPAGSGSFDRLLSVVSPCGRVQVTVGVHFDAERGEWTTGARYGTQAGTLRTFLGATLPLADDDRTALCAQVTADLALKGRLEHGARLAAGEAAHRGLLASR